MALLRQKLGIEKFCETKYRLMNAFEKEFLMLRLTQYGGNVSAASKASGMTRQNFQRLMKKHFITAKEYRP